MIQITNGKTGGRYEDIHTNTWAKTEVDFRHFGNQIRDIRKNSQIGAVWWTNSIEEKWTVKLQKKRVILNSKDERTGRGKQRLTTITYNDKHFSPF